MRAQAWAKFIIIINQTLTKSRVLQRGSPWSSPPRHSHRCREISIFIDKHRSSFKKDCCIKTIKGTGGCGYAAVTYKLYLDEDQFDVFRQSCHEFLVRVWRLMVWSIFVVYPFPVTVMTEFGSKTIPMNSEQEYLKFFSTRESLNSFSESNVEIQNMANMLNIDIHVFSYSETDFFWNRVYTPMPEITKWSEWAFPANDGLNPISHKVKEDPLSHRGGLLWPRA